MLKKGSKEATSQFITCLKTDHTQAKNIMQNYGIKRANEGSASYCPQTARGPQSNMKRTSKYDDFKFGSEPKDASN